MMGRAVSDDNAEEIDQQRFREGRTRKCGLLAFRPAFSSQNHLACRSFDMTHATHPFDALMALQQKISARRLKRKVGTRQQVIIDEVGPTVSKGRSKADAPEIDGAVYLSSRRPLRVGEIVTAKIERADQYDLHGSVAGF
jgi:ribosomal protein S12 methylthiotransferase